MKQGTIFNIQRYSLHDGPGIRTIIFLKGCPLKCAWCSNPESQPLRKQVVFKPDLCIGCSKCFSSCPTGERGREPFTICDIACGKCVNICPTEALEMIGEKVSVEQVMREVEKDRSFYRKSGGGMTLSGGEPLMQGEFALELIRAAKKSGIDTAIETTGYAKWEAAEEIFGEVDHILYDLKHMDDGLHKKYTGVSNRLILENLKKVAAKRSDALITRIPLIGMVNADEQNMKRSAEFLQEAGVRKVHLLPYHKYGEGKYHKLYRDYELQAITPEDAQIDSIIELMREYGISAKKSG